MHTAGPAKLEGRGIVLAAPRAAHRRAGRAHPQEAADEFPGALGLPVVLDPHLGQRGFDRQLAGDAGGVGIEKAGADSRARQVVYDELRLGKMGGVVDALQKRNETEPVIPSSLKPLRLDTL
jgi:hypothetical protein